MSRSSEGEIRLALGIGWVPQLSARPILSAVTGSVRRVYLNRKRCREYRNRQRVLANTARTARWGGRASGVLSSSHDPGGNTAVAERAYESSRREGRADVQPPD